MNIQLISVTVTILTFFSIIFLIFRSFLTEKPVSGLKICLNQRQSSPPPEKWWFDGFKTFDGKEFDVTALDSSNMQDGYSSHFEVEGFVSAFDTTKTGDLIGHILFTEHPQTHDFKHKFRFTEEGGFICTSNARGYARQIHVSKFTENSDEILQKLQKAYQNQQKIIISGQFFHMIFDDKEIQQCHFQDFDDKVTCPVANIYQIEIVK